jgi:hypothetical protein
MDPQTRLQFWTFYPQPVPPPSCCKDFAFYFAISQGLSFNLKSTVTASVLPNVHGKDTIPITETNTCIPRKGIAWSVSDFIYSHDQFAYSAVGKYVVRI